MQIEDDDEVFEWLTSEWDGQMEWDLYNIPKMSKHNISPSELETIIEKELLFLGKITPPEDVYWKVITK